MTKEWQRDEYTISTDRTRLDPAAIEGFLQSSYWAAERPAEIIRRSLEYSLVFGVYHGDRQIGLARVVTDYATFAWLCDVFINEECRGQGVGKWLVSVVVEHPELQ